MRFLRFLTFGLVAISLILLSQCGEDSINSPQGENNGQAVHDTVYVTITVHDTLYVTESDTVYVNRTDTVSVYGAPFSVNPENLSNGTITPGIYIQLTADIQSDTELNSDSLKYFWYMDGHEDAFVSMSDTIYWRAPSNPGTYQISVYVTDGHTGTTATLQVLCA